ncbi:MAG: YtxH domain-containing protein [Actinomadura sp.]
MKYRATFIIGAAVGYLLGTRAGRERYEQIKRAARRCAENPTVQETAGLLRAQAGELAGTAKDKVGSTLQGRFGDRIPGLRRTDDTEATDVPTPRPTESTPLRH